MNLCTNAWQAMEKKGEILEFAVTEKDMDAPPALPHLAPGRYVEIVIADQGMGIDPEIKERIYDLFFTTKDADKGTGLGLAMVHGIVTGLKGGIVCDSVAGQGTTFTIYLPLIRTAEDTSSAEPTRQTDLPGGKEHILFVDNEADLMATAGSMLKSIGYTVSSCTASEEGLAFFVKNPLAYDLLLTDHTMPKMTGEVLAGEVHRLRPEMPILLYTGSLVPITAEQAENLGIRKILAKPFHIADLAVTLRAVLSA